MNKYELHIGDALQIMRNLPNESVNCWITSPPYWGLRDYGVEGQLGLEKSPLEYALKLIEIFREARRILREDGTLWLNLGINYARDESKGQHKPGDSGKQDYIIRNDNGRTASGFDFKSHQSPSISTNEGFKGEERIWSVCHRSDCNGIGKCGFCWAQLSISALNIKPKDEMNLPHLIALSLQSDGWFFRQTIIWSKPNPMPESVKDRCTKSHEYIFLFSKNQRYYFDQDIIKEQADPSNFRSSPVMRRDVPPGTKTDQGLLNGRYFTERNKRSVWSVSTVPFKKAHFATFPPNLIKPCVLSGCPENGIVGDMFAGSGTTGYVSLKNHRRFVGIELNPEYANEIALPRLERESKRFKQMNLPLKGV